MKNSLFASIFAAGLLGPVLAVCGQTTQPATTQSAPSEFEVHEWVVFMLDAAQGQLNPDGMVTSSLPSFVGTRRHALAAKEKQNQPSPIGIIRLLGTANSKVDVLLEKLDGDFLCSWPRAESRSKQLLWRDLSLSAQPRTGQLQQAPEGHWFNTLRAGESAYLSTERGGSERFLLFDVRIPYVSPLKIKSGDLSLEVADVSKAPLHHVMFYESAQGKSWQGDAGDLLPVKTEPATQPSTTQSATRPTTKPTTKPTTRRAGSKAPKGANRANEAPSAPAAVVAGSGGKTDEWQVSLSPLANANVDQPAATKPASTTQPATTQAATTQAATKPATTMPAGSNKVKLAAAPTTQPAELAASWKPILLKAGLNDADCQVILQIIAANAFNSPRLTAVYLMDDAEFDRLLPMDVAPQPRKIVHVGIVIVKNADPTLGNDIDDLIAQLGDPVWSKREAATEALQQMGTLALPKLREAAKNKDVEIAWRAEKLIAQTHAP